jgi:hypothetical protein
MGTGGNTGTGGDFGTGGGSGDSGTDSDGSTSCDESGSPRETPCLVAEKYAVFVAPSGNATNPGTMAAPLRSLKAAMGLARTNGKIVIACNGTFDEQVSIEGASRVYGGFACPDTPTPWQPEPTAKARVAPSTGVPLRIAAGNASVILEDLEIASSNASQPGASSIAAFISDSSSVTLRRTKLAAGTGGNGTNATNPGFPYPTIQQLQGNDGAELTGGPTKQCTCPGSETTRGGGGGSPPDGSGSSGLPDHQGPGGEGGNPSLSCNAGGGGSDGAPGPAGTSAQPLTALGTQDANGWTPKSGTAGSKGAPGQGGGGGGAAKTAGGGGSGGCGGCGGQGGPAGAGGGASIALMAVNSPVMLVDSELISSTAGKGGNGAAGQQGQQDVGGGGRGAGIGGGQGCAGGNGGIGGNGGSGGGGAGGISVGVLYRGEAPTRQNSRVTLGTAGAKGLGGNPGANDGIGGVAQEELELP